MECIVYANLDHHQKFNSDAIIYYNLTLLRIVGLGARTIESKSMRERSFTLPHSGWYLPKRTAQWLLILVSVKYIHGEGLIPLTVGENQTPAGNNHHYNNYIYIIIHVWDFNTFTFTDVKDVDLIGPSSTISESGVPDKWRSRLDRTGRIPKPTYHCQSVVVEMNHATCSLSHQSSSSPSGWAEL